MHSIVTMTGRRTRVKSRICLLLLCLSWSNAFQTIQLQKQRKLETRNGSVPSDIRIDGPGIAFFRRKCHRPSIQRVVTAAAAVSPSNRGNDSNKNEKDNAPRSKRRALGRFLRRRVFGWPPRLARSLLRRPAVLGIVTAAFLSLGRFGRQDGVGGMLGPGVVVGPPAAHASAPVMALPKAEGRDPATEAIQEHNRRMQVKKQAEMDEMTRQAKEIEAKHGEKARVRFEKEYKEAQVRKAEEKQAGLLELKRNLLDQGIDPLTDLEGRRQVILYEQGVDLGEVSGTPYSVEKLLERTGSKKSLARTKATHRGIIACMVRDMKNRDVDPVEYFAARTDQTLAVMELPQDRAAALLEKYQANLERYGQITEPAPGEASALERMKQQQSKKKEDHSAAAADKKAAQQEAKRIKAEQKAKEREQKEQAKAEAKAAKEAAKKEKMAAKEAARKEKAAAKQAAAAAAAVAASTQAAGTEMMHGVAAELGTDQAAAAETAMPTDRQELEFGERQEDTEQQQTIPSPASSAVDVSPGSSSKKSLPIVPVSAALLAAGGGGYALKVYREKAAVAEAERQRQFRLLMGEEEGAADDDDGKVGPDATAASAAVLEGTNADTSATRERTPEPPPSAVEPESAQAEAAPKKSRRLGIKSIFGKKKNDFETDLNALVGADAKAPEFATLLAKLLTYATPGRFPDVVSLPGDLPMQEEFELDAAKQMLVDARAAADLPVEESANIFANVANCMLIDIVDLASSSLKEKDDKTKVDAISIVVQFMNHAASLYDSVAGGVTISPVTYGGDLSKSKLEQMYSAYAASGMMDIENIPDNFDGNVELLRSVFRINEKRAEGLMLKAVQKNMMEMMKSGGMDGMANMFGGGGGAGAGMGGMPGMEALMGAGAGGAGEEGLPNPEEVKEMLLALKEMKESGNVSPEDLKAARAQFKDALGGAGIDEIMNDVKNQGGELGQSERELLDLMKSILED